MFYKEIHAPGRFDLALKPDTPESVRALLVERGHLVFVEEEVDARRESDASMLSKSVFTGRLLRVTRNRLSGDHVTAWLGDSDNRGEIISVTQSFSSSPWSTFISSILPTSIVAGSVTNTPGNLTMDFFATTPKAAIDSAAELLVAEYRVNDNGTFDSGVASELYVVTPTTLITRKAEGFDPTIKSRGSNTLESVRDASRWAGEVFIAGTGDFANGGDDILIGQADLADLAKSNPYKNLQNVADGTGMIVNDPVSFAAQGNTRAQVILGKVSELANTVTLDVDNYDVDGDFAVGDQVFVYDPPLFTDPANTVRFAGEYVNPKAIRIYATTVPTKEGMGVYYRDKDGAYTDLTPYFERESGSTQVTVGERFRSPFDSSDNITSSLVAALNRPSNALTVPAVPAKANTPWNTASYVDGNGNTRAQVIVEWSTPLNTDGSTITDGDHYTVRFRRQGVTQYQYVNVAWNTLQLVIQDLAPGVAYDVSIAAYDYAGRTSGYGTDEVVTAAEDTVAPSQPAAPSVAGSPLAIQVSHDLGVSGGGTFNLESDLDHLNVYVGTTSGFTPNVSNKAGQISATSANLTLGITAIGTFDIPDDTTRWVKVTAVDKTGNESAPSVGASVTALLVDTANISNAAITTAKIGDLQVTTAKIALLAVENAQIKDLDAAKITTGFLAADRIEAGTIRSGKLVVGSFDNLVMDAGLETGDSVSASVHNFSQAFGGTWAVKYLAGDTQPPRTGAWQAEYLTTGQTNLAYWEFNHKSGEDLVACSVGDEFYAEAYCRGGGTTFNPVARIEFVWLNSDKTLNGVSATSYTTVLISASWTKVSHNAVAPAGACYVRARVAVDGFTNYNAGNILCVDDAYFRRMVGASIIESLWAKNFTLASAGSIESDNFVANTSGFQIVGDGTAEFNGAGITGGLIRTNVSGERIELEDHVTLGPSLNTFNSSGVRQLTITNNKISASGFFELNPLTYVSLDGGSAGALSTRITSPANAGTFTAEYLRLTSARDDFKFYASDDSGATRNARFYLAANYPSPTYPHIAAIGDPDTGVLWDAANELTLVCAGAREVLITSTAFTVPNVYASTSGSAANVFVDSAGRLFRSTASSERYKKNIKSYSKLDVLGVEPALWHVRKQPLAKPGMDAKDPAFVDYDNKQHLGFVAEQVAEVFPEAVVYEDGVPEGVDTLAILAGHQALLRELWRRVVDPSLPTT